MQDAVLQVLRMKCVPDGSGLRVVDAAEWTRPADELCDDELCDALLCDDALWLEPLDFATAGAAASAAAISAMDNDQASLVFSIVIPPEYE